MKRVFAVVAAVAMAALLLVGCEESPLSETLQQQNKVIAAHQSKLEANQPAPDIQFSNERANLIKRVTTFNDPNKVSYIYLISDTGVVMAFYTVKGKVSNLSSYLVPDQQIVDDPYNSESSQVVQAPDIDGSYGTNGGGVFFYTTDGTYVEWNGLYMLADKPLKMATQPMLYMSADGQ
jgi:outer membrane murein-binding lipoprotein Lpp